MAGTIHLPVLGDTKTSYVIAGGVVVTGIVGFAYYKHAHSPVAAGATTTAASSAVSTTTAGIDPETGYPYGSAQDEEALESLDSGGAYETGGGEYYPYSSTPVTSSNSTSTANTGPGTFTSDAQWLDWIVANNTTSYSSSQIVTACSIWLYGASGGSNSTLTTTDVSVILACEAVAGQPPSYPGAPQAGSGTPGGGTGSGGSGSGSTTMVKVPNVNLQRVNPGEAAITAAGLVPDVTSGGPRNPKDEYEIISQTPGAGKSVAKGSKVSLAIKQVS